MYLTLIIRYWKTAMFALLILGILGSTAYAYMHHLKNEKDDAIKDKLKVESDNTVLRQSLAASNSRYQALIKGQITFSDIDTSLLQKQEQANAELEKTIADLRSGNRRLRDRLAASSGGAGQTTASAGSCDARAESGLSVTDGEFLIRFADEADDAVRQLAACQEVIKADRNILSQQP